jgi:hypothetical protein
MKTRGKRNKSSGQGSEEGKKSGVRERTISHLEKLMRTATAAGAGLALVCNAQTKGQKPPVVCDPLPPPVGCCENPDQFLVRGCLDHQTQWHKVGGAWVLRLSLWAIHRPVKGVISFDALKKGSVRVQGAILRDFIKESQKVTLELAPVRNPKQVEVELSVQCDQKTIPLKLTLDLSEPPQENRSVPVTPLDRAPAKR